MAKDLKIPKITVLMPIFNGGSHLKTAIESILNQTYSNFEILAINDCSTDNTEETILAFKDPRIVYLKNEKNLGLIKTLNLGLELSRGEFIARMDQDDIANPKRFEKQIAILQQNPTIGVCGTWFTLFGDNTTIKTVEHPEDPETIKIELLSYCTLGHPTVMIRRAVIENIQYDEDYPAAEDYELWTRLSRTTKLYNIQESLLQYRIHNSNISVLQRNTQYEKSKRIIGNQLRFIDIDSKNENVELCQTLFSTIIHRRPTAKEFKNLVKFANSLEYHNRIQKYYDEKELNAIIQNRLIKILNKTSNKTFSTILFIIKQRLEIITDMGIIDNMKLIAKIILKK